MFANNITFYYSWDFIHQCFIIKTKHNLYNLYTNQNQKNNVNLKSFNFP